MLKKIRKELNNATPKQRKLLVRLCDASLVVVVVAFLLALVWAYNLYQDSGWGYCGQFEDPLTGESEKFCFNTSQERIDYVTNRTLPTESVNTFINPYTKKNTSI